MATPETDTETEGYDHDLAAQIIKILNHTSESLEEIELATFLKFVDRLGKEEMGVDEVKELILNCTELTLFKEGMTVHLTKQTVRSLIAINEDYNLSQAVWKEISRLAGPLIFSILADYGEIDAVTLAKYMDLLQHGTENVRHIRLMVVGMFGVGKTTIIRRLCNQDTEDVISTVGIDVSVNACEIDDNKQWKVRDLGANPDKYYKQRMSSGYHERVNVKREKKSQEKKTKEPQPKEKYERSTPKEANTKPVDIDHQPFSPDLHETEYVSEITPNPKPPANMQKITEDQDPRTKQFLGDVKEAVDDENEFEYIERMTTVSIWDFAGQSIYYSTHHFFLSARAIYLLVLDISRNLTDKVPEEELGSSGCNRATSMPKDFTCLDAFKFWMNSIFTYTAAQKDQALKEYKPTIVLVGTFKDKVKKEFPVESQQKGFLDRYMNDYFNEALLSMKGSPVLELVHDKKFFVSRYDETEIFDELKSDLTFIAKGQPFWDEIVPLQWIPLERSIERRKDESLSKETGSDDKKCTIMDLQELKQIDQETEFPLTEKKLFKLFLNFQHALGNVLYYDAEKLEDNIILDPQWILDVFKLFVTHVDNKKATYLEEWDNYENYAVLSQYLIEELIKNSKNESFQKYKDEIIHYMEYLDVIAKPVIFDRPPEGDCSSEEEDEEDEEDEIKEKWPKCQQNDFYIVPCLLSQIPPEEQLRDKTKKAAKYTPIMCFAFKNNFLPAFVYHRLIATCIRKWEVESFNGKRILFKTMGSFNLDQGRTTKLDLWWKDHVLYMQIFRFSSEGKPVNKTLGTRVRKQIQNMVREIFSIHRNISGKVTESNHDRYDGYIYCPKCFEEDEKNCDAGRVVLTERSKLTVETLMKVPEMNCGCNHTVSQEETLSYWFYKENQNYQMDDICKSRKYILDYLKSISDESEVTETHIAKLSEGIGKEYMALGIELGLRIEKIQQLKHDESDIQTCIKNILVAWTKSCPELPTMAMFKSAFYKIIGFRFRFTNRIDRMKEIVKWYERIEKPKESPSDMELIEITYLVGGRYRGLAKKLLTTNSYSKIEQVEMQYSLGFNMTLDILHTWARKSENVTFTFLKDCLVDMFKINWELTKKRIEDDEAEAKLAAERKTYLQRETDDPEHMRRFRDMVERTGGNGSPFIGEEVIYNRQMQAQGQTSREETESTSSSEQDNE